MMAMLTRVKIHVVDWDDPRFVVALQHAWKGIVSCGVDLDSPVAASRCETMLHDAGFPTAEVNYDRSVDDIAAGVATWVVRRDGPGRDDARRHGSRRDVRPDGTRASHPAAAGL